MIYMIFTLLYLWIWFFFVIQVYLVYTNEMKVTESWYSLHLKNASYVFVTGVFYSIYN